MTRRKNTKTQIGAITSTQGQLHYFRYGPISTEKHFQLALGVFRSASLTEEFTREVRDRGLGVFLAVANLVRRLQALPHEPRDEIRLRYLQAHLDFLAAAGRPPTQSEHLRRVWELRVIDSPSARNHFPLEDKKACDQRLDSFFRNPEKIPPGLPKPPDRRNHSRLLQDLRLDLLDGQPLLEYRRVFNEATDGSDLPSASEFKAKVRSDPRLRDRPQPLPFGEQPFGALLEVLATPFDPHPLGRWMGLFETQVQLIRAKTEALTGVDMDRRTDAEALFEAIFHLDAFLILLREGVEMRPESISDSNLPLHAYWPDLTLGTNILELSSIELDQLRMRFKEASEKTGNLPSFCDFWLAESEALSIVLQSRRIRDVCREQAKVLAESYQECSKGASEPCLEKISEKCPAIGVLTSVFEESYLIREPMIYWSALSIDPDLRKKGGKSLGWPG